MTPNNPDTPGIDAETMAKAKHCVIGILCDLAKAEVKGLPLLDDGSADRFGQIIAGAIQAAKAEERQRPAPKSLRVFLAEKGIRQRGFAASIGTSPVVLSRIIMGDRKPGPKMILRIEAATGGEVNFHSWFPPLAALARVNAEADNALDTARREWAKKGEG